MIHVITYIYIFHANDIILFIGDAVMCLCLFIFLLITSLLMYAINVCYIECPNL